MIPHLKGMSYTQQPFLDIFPNYLLNISIQSHREHRFFFWIFKFFRRTILKALIPESSPIKKMTYNILKEKL